MSMDINDNKRPRLTFDEKIIREVTEKENRKEDTLSQYAFKSADATYFKRNAGADSRPAFFHDIDTVIYSRAYTRYIDKTQVFYLIENDHITHRVLHVQLVSKIAKTIGRFLGLNEDLIEAISLGHDVGHTPFGHNGEKIIAKFCKEKDGCDFKHNIQSFRLFYELENGGSGCNISVQTLDGIICHNGEITSQSYTYNQNKTKEDLLKDYTDSLQEDKSKHMQPMTMEACVMRISDIIAYVGRDIEDAITLRLINREDIPVYIAQTIGNKNRDIVNNLIVDLVNNSYGKETISFSKDYSEALDRLIQWNNNNIYNNPKKIVQDTKIENMFNSVLQSCLNDIYKASNVTGIKDYLKEMGTLYCAKYSKYRIVADYVSGMTDDFLIKTFEKNSYA